MNLKKIYELIGISFIAKKLCWGEKSCLENIKHAKLIAISCDIGNSTKKKFTVLSDKYQLPLLVLGSKFDMGLAIGKQMVSVIIITDTKLSDKIKKIWRCKFEEDSCL